MAKPARSSIGSSSQLNVLNSVRICVSSSSRVHPSWALRDARSSAEIDHGTGRTESSLLQDSEIVAGVHLCLAVVPSDVIPVEVLGPGVLQFIERDGFSHVLHSSTGWSRKRSDPSSHPSAPRQ